MLFHWRQLFFMTILQKRGDDKMHIVLATYEFVTENIFCGGLSNYLANISTILAEHGHRITILVLSKRFCTVDWKPNIKVVRVQPNHGKLWHILLQNSADSEKKVLSVYLGNSYSINKKILEIDKVDKIDIVQYWGDQGAAYYRPRSIPSVVRISSYPPIWRLAYHPNFSFEEAIHKKVLIHEKFSLSALKRVDAVYGPSQYIANLISQKINKKIDVIESPFLTKNINIDDTLYLEKFQGKKYLLFFGTLGYFKGIHNIIAILDEFLNKYQDFYFAFIGKDLGVADKDDYMPAVRAIEEAAGANRDRIIYIPEMNQRSQMFSVISHAYACVLPSRMDNLPNTCIESMALGKIVIGTRGASFEQLIEDGKSGFLIERDNPKSLMHAIDLFMGMSETDRAKMGQLAMCRTEKMKPEYIYEQLIKYYQDIINKKSKL